MRGVRVRLRRVHLHGLRPGLLAAPRQEGMLPAADQAYQVCLREPRLAAGETERRDSTQCGSFAVADRRSIDVKARREINEIMFCTCTAFGIRCNNRDVLAARDYIADNIKGRSHAIGEVRTEETGGRFICTSLPPGCASPRVMKRNYRAAPSDCYIFAAPYNREAYNHLITKRS